MENKTNINNCENILKDIACSMGIKVIRLHPDDKYIDNIIYSIVEPIYLSKEDINKIKSKSKIF